MQHHIHNIGLPYFSCAESSVKPEADENYSTLSRSLFNGGPLALDRLNMI